MCVCVSINGKTRFICFKILVRSVLKYCFINSKIMFFY